MSNYTIQETEEGKYKGETQNNIRTGKGTFYWNNGRKYIGDWLDNKKEGHGFLYYETGNTYIGQLKSDKREGYGTFYNNEGEVFEGQRCVKRDACNADRSPRLGEVRQRRDGIRHGVGTGRL